MVRWMHSVPAPQSLWLLQNETQPIAELQHSPSPHSAIDPANLLSLHTSPPFAPVTNVPCWAPGVFFSVMQRPP